MTDARSNGASKLWRFSLVVLLFCQIVFAALPAAAADLSSCFKISAADKTRLKEWERGGCSTKGATCTLEALSIQEVETKLREVQSFNLKHASDTPPRSRNLLGGYSACDGVRQVYAIEEYSAGGAGDVFSAGPDQAPPSTTRPVPSPSTGEIFSSGNKGVSDICAKSPDSYHCVFGSRRPPSGAPLSQPPQQGGGKSVVRTGAPDEQASPDDPTPANIAAAIDACLQNEASGLTYYKSPALATGGRTVAYDSSGNGAIRYNPTFLNGLTPWYRAFWLADAYATHVISLEQQRFNVNRPPREFQRARDYLAGFALHCVWFKIPGLDDPRIPLEKYLGWPYHFSFNNEPTRGTWEIQDWNNGWNDQTTRVNFSLRHDPALPPTQFDPYRWP